MPYQDEALAKLKSFEGCIPWMYLDSVGKVTVGIGLMLPDVAAALAVPFQQSAGDTHDADPEPVQQEFARVSKMEANHSAGYYRTTLSPVLSMETMERLCRERITEGEIGLRELFPGYDAMPDAVKVALIDMQYNLGTHGLGKYMHLRAALEAGNLPLAAVECHRFGIQPERNEWTTQQFLAAAHAA
jgi:GH24 family phage-related lysozyme (muramidase)